MAARENQGYLIAVIILVLLLLVASLAAFMGIQKANELAETAKAQEEKAKKAQATSEAYQIQSQILQAYVGLKGTVSEANQNLNRLNNLSGVDEAIRNEANNFDAEFQKDMKMYIASEENDETRTYRTLVNNLAVTAGKLHNDKSILTKEKERIQTKTAQEVAEMQTKLTDAETNYQDTLTALNKEKEDRQADVNKLQGQLTAIAKENEDINRLNEDKVNEIANKLSRSETALAKSEEDKETLKAKVDQYEREVFDLPDGRILGVSPEIKMVVVNLGSDDGLRPNTTFSVYDKNVTNFQKDEHKAMVEITRVVGPHQSEGRITLERPNDPILTNDYILTATWDPGHRVPIALAGWFDLDGDGISDLARLRAEIERNSGMVVVYHDEKGEIMGPNGPKSAIDASTRFFVRGDVPKVGIKNYNDVINTMNKLEAQAENYSVQEISVKKLYNWMGKHPRLKIERLDSRQGEEFRERTPADSAIR